MLGAALREGVGMLQHSSDLWQGIAFLHGIAGPCLHLGLLQVLKIALPTPVYPPCLSVDFCVLYSSLTGNTWCCASLLAALKDPMQEQWPLHPGMHRRHLDISAGVSYPRVFWTEGALVVTFTVCSSARDFVRPEELSPLQG